MGSVEHDVPHRGAGMLGRDVDLTRILGAQVVLQPGADGGFRAGPRDAVNRREYISHRWLVALFLLNRLHNNSARTSHLSKSY